MINVDEYTPPSSCNVSLAAASDTDYGVEQGVLIIPYLLFVTLNIGPTLFAAFLGSYVEVCVYTELC